MVDLGGSLAVASMGLYATGVSTDLNVTYLSSGGKIGDKLQGTAVCEKSTFLFPSLLTSEKGAGDWFGKVGGFANVFVWYGSWQDACLYSGHLPQRQGRACCQGKSYKVRPCLLDICVCHLC